MTLDRAGLLRDILEAVRQSKSHEAAADWLDRTIARIRAEECEACAKIVYAADVPLEMFLTRKRLVARLQRRASGWRDPERERAARTRQR